MSQQTAGYVGIDNDDNAGMTALARIVRDAWVFGLLPESETCQGWSAQQMQGLYEQVHTAWEPYGHLPSRLPEELRTRHARIHDAALERARAQGWDANLDEEDE